MKTSMLFLFAFCVFAAASHAQNYDADLQSLLPKIGIAKTPADYSLLSSQLGSLAQSEPNRWEASFYGAHCMVLQAFAEDDKDKVDEVLDQAELVLDQLIKKNASEPEYYVEKAMLNQARISVSPILRGMKYSGRASENVKEALKLDPNNPRAWYLKASNVFYTPSMFGGGAEKAKPLFQKAAKKFETYKHRGPYYPSWGKEQNGAMLKQCNKQ